MIALILKNVNLHSFYKLLFKFVVKIMKLINLEKNLRKSQIVTKNLGNE